ncbi:hypothetical protein E2C01_016585 [Portunus trituberculatus]|uniref:Uncharacterized protein n=1 Tax=Portunus trituberculatus TaxID=210409 RepID=A0A5B7DPT1_PORTR|nr:hypothetical protein [Portunus trituberculatus]
MGTEIRYFTIVLWQVQPSPREAASRFSQNVTFIMIKRVSLAGMREWRAKPTPPPLRDVRAQRKTDVLQPYFMGLSHRNVFLPRTSTNRNSNNVVCHQAFFPFPLFFSSSPPFEHRRLHNGRLFYLIKYKRASVLLRSMMDCYGRRHSYCNGFFV